MKTNELYNKVENVNARSAWNKGVKWYALYLIEQMEEHTKVVPERSKIEPVLLNGASDWKQYSEGGCALVYNQDIAGTLCSPSELKKTKNGANNPNRRETWLDVQARALFHACDLIKSML